jgi:tripartite-type tricarboxylate transporter receptor subunit TctC
VVGFPPGGQTDFAGRVVLVGLQNALGQPVLIDNRPGANGNIGTDYVAKSPADGYRLLVGNGGNMTLNPHTYRNSAVPDPTKFTPIGTLLTSSLMLVVPSSLPVKTYAEFVAWVKAQDKAGKDIDYASAGPGSMSQAVMELFREQIGKPKMNHVPYKGSGPAMTDLIAGRVNGMFDGASVVAPFVKSGQLRALMTTGTTRVPAFPDVPTAVECGIKDFQISAFLGLYGPAGLDPEIVKKVNAAMNATLKDPAVQKTITDRGDEPGGGTPEQLGTMTRNYFKLWADVAKNNDIRAE